MQVNAFLHLKYVEKRNIENLRIAGFVIAIADGFLEWLVEYLNYSFD